MYLRRRTSFAVFRHCSFQANIANSASAGAIRIEQFASVEIYDSLLSENSAPEGSAVSVQKFEVPLYIVNTSFVENQGEGVIHLADSVLRLADVSLTRNSGPKTGGLVLVNSEVSAVGSTFAEISGLQGCVLSVLQTSTSPLRLAI